MNLSIKLEDIDLGFHSSFSPRPRLTMQFRLFVLTAVLLCFTPEICSAHSPLHTIIKVKYAAEQIIKELSGSPAAAAAAGVEAEAAPAHVPQRSKRAAPYSPVTTPSYDFGPKTACSKPDVSGCSVESSVTIPSYLTRFTTGTLGNAIDELVDVVKETVNNDCGDSVRDMFCELIAQPICTSDNKAMYNFNLQEVIRIEHARGRFNCTVHLL